MRSFDRGDLIDILGIRIKQQPDPPDKAACIANQCATKNESAIELPELIYRTEKSKIYTVYKTKNSL